MPPPRSKLCTVCRAAGKPAAQYRSHFVKDRPGGKTVCPYLLSLRCPTCGAQGHTRTHCPGIKPARKITSPCIAPRPAAKARAAPAVRQPVPLLNAFKSIEPEDSSSESDSDSDSESEPIPARPALHGAWAAGPPSSQGRAPSPLSPLRPVEPSTCSWGDSSDEET